MMLRVGMEAVGQPCVDTECYRGCEQYGGSPSYCTSFCAAACPQTKPAAPAEGIIPIAQGYGMDPNECYTGCLATGAGNCAEICGVPIYKATTISLTCLNYDDKGNCIEGKKSDQLIPGLENGYLLLAVAAVAVVVIVSR